ncbi:hypothetical protein RND71_019541 [Anisodus tanguticus]|uniref:Glycine-rich domain-containing protein 1 n=1 Tax=Anisodus tanguticus TaxID=243964 RepID=A0AAE1S0E2_9SOLA|nr:hypothetical protein RND71_019541 [Anisodus tanguticus]
MLQSGNRMDISDERMQLEWNEAQKTVINVDLVAAAKEQLKFLATVDRNRWLYESRGLDNAIHRYYSCWLPLLAKHSRVPYFDGPLVVPLDSEWIWHCHRLNPVRYKTDCEKLYGRILDNYDVVSSVNAKSKQDTEELWKLLYPNEPYDLDSARALSEVHAKPVQAEKCSDYDLVSAVKRQSPFFYQVSKRMLRLLFLSIAQDISSQTSSQAPVLNALLENQCDVKVLFSLYQMLQVSRRHMNNDLYLEGAVAQYKGFLHLIRRNKERSIKSFTVPTYDIDLIWHTHQLYPASYCKDLVDIMGKVLEHDDTDSDRTKGKKLDTGFSRTTKQWEETYGSRYWRAGAMYRGSSPSPLTTSHYCSNPVSKKADAFHEHQKILHYPEMEAVEVMLEFVDIRNLPEGHKGSFFVSFSKTQPDRIFNAKKELTILSVSGEKQVAYFQCEPNGHLLFDLMSYSSSGLPIPKSVKAMGSAKVSLEDLVCPTSKLTMEKWLEVVPSSKMKTVQPICLRVAISVATPMAVPYVFHFIRPRAYSKTSCFFPLPGRIQYAKNCTRIIDDAGDEVISLQMRDLKKSKGKIDSKEVIGISKSGEVHSLAELVGKEWLLLDAQWSLQLQISSSDDGHLFELAGHRNVKFFLGQRLDYEHKHCTKQRSHDDFMTAIEFSAQDPYGKALALIDLKFGVINVKEEWFLLPGSITVFLLSDTLRKEGCSILVGSAKHSQKDFPTQETDLCHEEGNRANLESEAENVVQLNLEATKGNNAAPAKGAISGGCGSSCGSLMKSGACGSCGAGCGNKLESGGCGGCGSGGCGSMLESSGFGGCGSGCGGGCGGGCGSRLKSSGCGGCGGSGGCGGGGCGGAWGNRLKSSGCGGCGGGGCGDGLTSVKTAEVNA